MGKYIRCIIGTTVQVKTLAIKIFAIKYIFWIIFIVGQILDSRDGIIKWNIIGTLVHRSFRLWGFRLWIWIYAVNMGRRKGHIICWPLMTFWIHPKMIKKKLSSSWPQANIEGHWLDSDLIPRLFEIFGNFK